MPWNIGQYRRRSRRFWQELSPLASLLFFLSVFCLFATIGFLGKSGAALSWAGLRVPALSGLTAVAFAYLGTRSKLHWIAAALVASALAEKYWLYGAGPATPLSGSSRMMMLLIIAAYVLMLFFISLEGRRYYRLEAEVELAGNIHRALAPPIAARVGEFEFAGQSRSSGTVGGDLLDLVETPEGWLCYIADVSGHGIAAGVLMGVVKSAARTWLNAEPEPERLLGGLNRGLEAMLPPESYVTLIGLGGGGAGGRLALLAAGHPPMMQYQAESGAVRRVEVENFPLGLFAAATFANARIEVGPGDLVLLYTDGLSEVCDAQGNEFGLEGIERALAGAAALPMASALDHIVGAVRAHGAQTDDQTLVLVRRQAG